jgi:hypothetical protein
MMREALARGSVTRASSAEGWQPAGSDQFPPKP